MSERQRDVRRQRRDVSQTRARRIFDRRFILGDVASGSVSAHTRSHTAVLSLLACGQQGERAGRRAGVRADRARRAANQEASVSVEADCLDAAMRLALTEPHTALTGRFSQTYPAVSYRKSTESDPDRNVHQKTFLAQRKFSSFHRLISFQRRE